MDPIRALLVCSLLAAAAGCSQSQPDKSSEGNPAKLAAPLANSAVPASPPTAALPVAAVVPKATQKVELEIGAVASTMTFDKTSLTVPSGAEVHLVLKDAKPGTLMHNWVLVKPGTEAAVAAAGLPAGPAGNFLTPGPDVLAFTPMAQPGGTSEVTFQAPPPGSYPYICSFPGHYLMMKGTLVVTP
jgi:azurin